MDPPNEVNISDDSGANSVLNQSFIDEWDTSSSINESAEKMSTVLPTKRHSILAGNTIVYPSVPKIKLNDEFGFTRDTIAIDETVLDGSSEKADEAVDSYSEGESDAEIDENTPGFSWIFHNLSGAELGDSGILPEIEELKLAEVEKTISVTPIKPVTELRQIFSPHPENQPQQCVGVPTVVVTKPSPVHKKIIIPDKFKKIVSPIAEYRRGKAVVNGRKIVMKNF